ncbi:hypothetical protein QJS10_CPB11g00833 [Acorus calamus]|uniref:Uncharacterized protein n=1 Tax=Acorus calamus TaxID=4465 RepID=A0AAV9DV21_ACOCL|nr:hypothetical protein QJS10_CPB11g00833 [Acorus calamus]
MRMPTTSSHEVISPTLHTTNVAHHLYPIIEQGTTMEVVHRLPRYVIHYLEDRTPLPDIVFMQHNDKTKARSTCMN